MMIIIYAFLSGLFIVILFYAIGIYRNKSIRKSATLDIEELLAEINKGILSTIWETRPRERIFFHSIWGMDEPEESRKILFIGENCKHCLVFILKNLPPLFTKKSNKRILYIDLKKCKTDKHFDFLVSILRKLGHFNPFEAFINSIEIALHIQRDSYSFKRTQNEVLNLIVNKINKEKIIVILNNCESKLDKDISNFLSDIIDRINDVSILSKPIINPDISIDNRIRKIQLSPNIFFDSAIFFASQHKVFEFQNKIYNGVDDIIFRSKNPSMYLLSRLKLSDNLFYRELFKLFGGIESYLLRSNGIEHIKGVYKDLLHDESLLKKFYRTFFEKRIESLDDATLNLLLFICIAPFSVHYSDIKAFCDSSNIDFEDSTGILEDYLLIFRTNPSYYINLSLEFNLFKKEYPNLDIVYFANGTNTDDLPYYLNCDDARPLVRALINEALLQRFHKDWGYYTTNPLRRIIRLLFSENDSYKKVVQWAYQYYIDLRETHDSPSVELAYAFFCNENNKFLEKENYIDVSYERIISLCSQESSAPKEAFCYYSILLNKKTNVLLSDKSFMHNILFCYSHILNLPGAITSFLEDKEDIEDDAELSDRDKSNTKEIDK